MRTANLSDIQRHMLLAKLNLQDESNMYTNMKIALKDFNIESQSTFYQKFNKSSKLMRKSKSKCNKKNQGCKFEHPEDSKEESKNSKWFKNDLQKKAKESKPKQNFVVYSTLNVSTNEHIAILDSGCPLSVCGRRWIEKFVQQYGKDSILRRVKEEERFKFGSSKIYDSTERVTLKVRMEDNTWVIKCSVIQLDIPLLLGNDFMKDNSISLINDSQKKSYIQLTDGKKIEKYNMGHWKVTLEGINMKDSSTFFESNKNSDEEKPVQNLKMKDIAKLHKNSFHKSKEKLEELLKASQNLNQETKRLISRVVDNCKICKLFKKRHLFPRRHFLKHTPSMK